MKNYADCKKYIKYKCEICGKMFTKSNPKNAGRFCSRICYYVWNKDHNPMKGRSQSAEAKEKCRLASTDKHYNLGKIHTPESKEKNRLASTGKKHKEETKKYLHDIRIGDKNPFYGKKHTETIKIEMSENRTSDKNAFFGCKHSEEAKKKQAIQSRERFVENLKLIDKNWHPPFNKEACKKFEIVDELLSTNGQYATNGGEYFIKEICRWVDYINFDLKIIIEFYESRHYKTKYLVRDEKRIDEIESYMKDFKILIINEQTNLKEFVDKLIYS